MTEQHWFDVLNKLLTHHTARRGMLRAAVALTLAQRLPATDASAKNGGKGGKNKGNGNRNGSGNGNRNRNRNGNGNGKQNGNGKRNGNGSGSGSGTGNDAASTPNPPQSCSGGSCAQQWAGIDTEIAYCEFICQQCDGEDSREFCIAEGDPNDPSKIAVCCDLPAPHCCDGKCTDRQLDENNCGTCGNACDAGEVCRNGGCVCEGPDCVCQRCVGPGLECCPGGECVFVGGQDSNNCGGCGVTCPRGQRCIDGTCGCGNGFKYCPLAERCVEERFECCGGLPGGYCIPPFPCCGSGLNAYCSPYLTCP